MKVKKGERLEEKYKGKTEKRKGNNTGKRKRCQKRLHDVIKVADGGEKHCNKKEKRIK